MVSIPDLEGVKSKADLREYFADIRKLYHCFI